MFRRKSAIEIKNADQLAVMRRADVAPEEFHRYWREEHGPLAESVGGQWVLKLMLESKAVPSSVINRKARDRAAEIEALTGRKPGKKETRELKEDEDLPLGFTFLGADASTVLAIAPRATRAPGTLGAYRFTSRTIRKAPAPIATDRKSVV